MITDPLFIVFNFVIQVHKSSEDMELKNGHLKKTQG